MKLFQYLYRKCIVNYKIKLFSLLSALFFWFYVTIDNPYTQVTDVPLHLVNKPEGFIPLKPLPSSVRVEFKGTGKAFLSYAFRDRRIELDLHQISKSTWMGFSLDMIKDIPPGMDLHPVRIVFPDSVFIEFDRKVFKRVHVRPDMMIFPRDGFVQVGEVQFIPDSVMVSGPQLRVDQVQDVQTKNLEFRDVDEPISGKVSILPEHLEYLLYSDKFVHFKIDIQRLGERVFDTIPVRLINAPAGVKMTIVPSTLSLKLQGGVDALSRLRLEDLSAVIDYESRYRSNKNRYPAMVKLPKDIYFSDVQPKLFELIVEK